MSSAAELTFKKPDGKLFKVNIEGQDQKLLASGLCNTLVGTSVIKSDKNGKKISFSDEGVSISDSSFKFGLATCGKRPTVDLSRLLP